MVNMCLLAPMVMMPQAPVLLGLCRSTRQSAIVPITTPHIFLCTVMWLYRKEETPDSLQWRKLQDCLLPSSHSAWLCAHVETGWHNLRWSKHHHHTPPESAPFQVPAWLWVWGGKEGAGNSKMHVCCLGPPEGLQLAFNVPQLFNHSQCFCDSYLDNYKKVLSIGQFSHLYAPFWRG